MELEIEALMDRDCRRPPGRARARSAAPRGSTMPPGRYIEVAKASFPRGLRLDGLRIVVDCANGAAYKVAPDRASGSWAPTVIPVGVAPDGFNINKGCGSTVPEYLCAQVVEHGADLGIALDGDADRLVICRRDAASWSTATRSWR